MFQVSVFFSNLQLYYLEFKVPFWLEIKFNSCFSIKVTITMMSQYSFFACCLLQQLTLLLMGGGSGISPPSPLIGHKGLVSSINCSVKMIGCLTNSKTFSHKNFLILTDLIKMELNRRRMKCSVFPKKCIVDTLVVGTNTTHLFVDIHGLKIR